MHRLTKVILRVIGGLSVLAGIIVGVQGKAVDGAVAFVVTGSLLFALVIITLLACLVVNWLVKAVF